jgi:hypothetical protein
LDILPSDSCSSAKEEEQLNQANNAIQAERDGPPLNRPNSLQEAQKRNAAILRELGVAKARLRSRASYSPLEAILQKAVQNYLDEPGHFSSQNTTSSPEKSTTTSSIVRKTYGPTYL